MSLAVPFPFPLAVFLAALPSAALDGRAAEVSSPVELVREALERNPDVQAARSAAEAARQRPAQASALPDPMIAVGYDNDGWTPSLGDQQMTRLGVMWSQGLPWPGKLELRGRVASSEALAVEQRLDRVRLSVEAEVRRAHADLLLARRLHALVREQQEVLRQIEGVALARYGVGQGAQQDVLRVQIEVTRIRQSLAEQEATEAMRLAELNRLLARPVSTPLETGEPPALQPETRPLAELIERAADTSPELRAAEAAVERGRLLVALARKEWKPDFSVEAGYMNRGGLEPMWRVGVAVTLPARRARRRAGLAEAQAALLEAESRRESLRLLLRFRTEERLAKLRALAEVAALYERGVVPQDRMSVESAVANYQAGKVPFIAVLESLATLYADRATELRLATSHARVAASLAEASLEPDGEAMVAPAAAGMGGPPGTGATVGAAGMMSPAGEMAR